MPRAWETRTWRAAWLRTSPTTQALAERDARNIEHLAAELRTKAVIRVPYLDEDVHDLAGLAQINRYLFASSKERAAIAAGSS